jgi:hypothetical protein
VHEVAGEFELRLVELRRCGSECVDGLEADSGEGESQRFC